MPGFALVVLALLVLGAAVGVATVIGSPFLALPIVAVALAAWAGVEVVRRGRGRKPLSGEPEGPIEFTERDRETLTPRSEPRERPRP